MPFTSPLALLGLLFVPAVLAMYLLKLRRDETVVPSTLLWTRLVADVEANAPWQRLRRSLLLLLQLLLVGILALLAARPFLERPAGLARDVVLVLDTSASMAATDVTPSRLEAAKAAALDALRDLPTGGVVSVIAADRTARIVVNETTDLGRVRQALTTIQPSNASGDLGDALELAGKLAARSADAQILVATDGALATPVTGTVDAPIKVLAVGRSHRNQAIVALAVRTSPSAVTRSVFISIANLDLEYAQRRIELRGPDGLIEVRDVQLDPQARADVVIDDVPADVGTLEVRLVGSDPAVTAAPDDLATDDTAWAVVPAQPGSEHPAGQRRRSVPGDGARLPPERAPVRRDPGSVPGRRGPAGRHVVGPDHLRGHAAGDASRHADPGHRPAELERARRGDRDAQGSRHRLAEPGRADPALRRPVHDAHRRGGRSSRFRIGPGRSSRARGARRSCTPAPGPACPRRSWPSIPGTPTCRSRSPSRSCWPT